LEERFAPKKEKLTAQENDLKQELDHLKEQEKPRQGKLKPLRRKKIKLEKKQKQQFTEETQQDLATVEQEIENIKQESLEPEIAQKNKEIKTIHQKRRKIDHKIKTAALNPDALKNLSDFLVDSFEESLPGETQKYIPYTLHNILLAFLWRKAASKKEFIDYYAAVVSPKMLTEPKILDKDSPEQQSWLAEAYPKKSYEEFLSDFESILQKAEENPKLLEDFVEKNYERLVAAWHSYNVFTTVFPPQATGGNPIYKGHQFPDCGETSLRNFFQ